MFSISKSCFFYVSSSFSSSFSSSSSSFSSSFSSFSSYSFSFSLFSSFFSSSSSSFSSFSSFCYFCSSSSFPSSYLLLILFYLLLMKVLPLIIIMEREAKVSPCGKGLEASENLTFLYLGCIFHYLATASSDESFLTFLALPMVILGQIKLSKHLQKYSTFYVENCDI